MNLLPAASWNEIAGWLFADAGTLGEIRARYKETEEIRSRIIAVPAQPNMLSHITGPLHAAWVDYVMGNYLGTIALCGMIGEMLAMLIHELIVRKGENRASFVDDFARCRQAKRLKVLSGRCRPRQGRKFGLNGAQSLLANGVYEALDGIHRTRIVYYHSYSKSLSNVRRDAKNIYSKTVAAVNEVIGLDVHQARLRLKPRVFPYLMWCMRSDLANVFRRYEQFQRY